MLNPMPEPAVTLTREVRAINQNARVFSTSLAVQSTCVAAVRGGILLPPARFSIAEESIGAAPSGNNPMSSGRRRTTIIKGMVRTRLTTPR